LFYKKKIINDFNLTKNQIFKIEDFINEARSYNSHTNIVGPSTLHNPWKSHVLDSIQLHNLFKNKSSSILDMGTGAGLPGIILSIYGYNKVSLVDSNSKKIKFITSVCKKCKINVKIFHERVEKIPLKKYDFVTARALANLNTLFLYSFRFLKKETKLIFLKGSSVFDEINIAKKYWKFNYNIKNSISDKRGKIIIVTSLNKYD
tara:strand:- start:20729 stop:21340 length:612 start_codon:yes stop_codon:yes gene_type:complete